MTPNLGPAIHPEALLDVVGRGYDTAFAPLARKDPYWRQAAIELARELEAAEQRQRHLQLALEDLLRLAENPAQLGERLDDSPTAFGGHWRELDPRIRGAIVFGAGPRPDRATS